MRDHRSSFLRRRLPWFLLPACLCLLAGCGQETGEVRRTVSISHPLSQATITAAIAAAPGVRLTEEWGDKPATDEPTFVYDDDAAAVNGLLTVRRGGHGTYLLTLSKTWAALTPTPGEVQKTRLLMDRVYLALRQRDSALPPPSELKEKSFGPVPPS